MSQKKLGEILVEEKIITPDQLSDAVKQQAQLAQPLGETLVRLKYVTESVLLEVLSRRLNLDFLDLAEGDYQLIDKNLAHVLPMDVCKKYHIIPVFQLIDGQSRVLTLAMLDPLNEKAIAEVEKLTKCQVSPVLTTRSALEGGLRKMFDMKVEVPPKAVQVEESHVVKMVNKILTTGVSLGASDIHIEPHAKEVHVRMRVDGVLQLISTIALPYLPPVVSRLKIMGSEQSSFMKIEEKRLPQDGSFSRIIGGHTVDSRMSTLPTIYGEKVVLRLFDKDKATQIGRISDLKMPPRTEKELKRCVRQPSGIVVVTGPTGSGKTSTLNAVVNEINDVEINIVTVEDPVEYHAPEYVNQSSLMPQAGYTYARALRAIMRQDPDVILIGEVRDLETAEIAVQAALTGHQVYTTLHTEDAAGAVVRLIDIGVEPFLVGSTLVAAINQRLLRKICSNCMKDYLPGKEEMLNIGIDVRVVDEVLSDPKRFTIRKSQGCNACHQTGYRGRQGAFELLTVTPTVRDLILRRQNSDVITAKAREEDSVNLIFEEGLRLVLTGVTSLAEMQRLPRGDYKMKSVDQIFIDAEVKSEVN